MEAEEVTQDEIAQTTETLQKIRQAMKENGMHTESCRVDEVCADIEVLFED